MNTKQVAVIVGVVLFIAFAVLWSSQMSTKNSDQTNAPLNLNFDVQNATPKAAPITDLRIEDIKQGTGSAVAAGDTITVNYIGTLLDGSKFDSSYDRNQPFTTQIGVGNVIEGWDQGLLGMKVGGKRKLTVPPSMGYGSQPAGSIPPNSVLIFETELLNVEKASPSATPQT